jgi:hypothetical protein
MNGWKDHFLVGNNQYGAPFVVAFRVNDGCDTVGIYGYTRIHPMSENRRNPRFAPLLPSALGMIVTSPRFNATKFAARIIWQDLLNYKQYNMKEISFSDLYPNHVFDPVEIAKHTKEFTRPDQYFANTQYALQA